MDQHRCVLTQQRRELESLKGGGVLGLHVQRHEEVLFWSLDNVLDSLTDQVKRRRLFSWCGQMIGHFPVASWVRPACSYLKRMTNGSQWNEEVDAWVIKIVKSMQNRIEKEDPVGGVWYVSNVEEERVWCDASSIAIGTCVEIDGSIVEDACWLRKQDDSNHINIAELDSTIMPSLLLL
jgi:hypothetical protein